MKALIRVGADINFNDGNGFCPLTIAASGHNVKALRILYKAGATLCKDVYTDVEDGFAKHIFLEAIDPTFATARLLIKYYGVQLPIQNVYKFDDTDYEFSLKPWAFKWVFEHRCRTCCKLCLLKCARCKRARYCNLQCQRINWANHKPLCKIQE
jgi:hypothetical protein